MASMTLRPRYDMEVVERRAPCAGWALRGPQFGLGTGRVVASFLNRIGAAVPAFKVCEAIVEYTGSLLAANEPDRSLIRWQIARRSASFLRPHLTDTTLDTMDF
jgi:hypothetical protein